MLSQLTGTEIIFIIFFHPLTAAQSFSIPIADSNSCVNILHKPLSQLMLI
jgi:hypothetical protein